MLQVLKQMAIKQLMSKMASNALGAAATQQAASQGAGGIMDIIMSKVSGGQLDQVTDLFSAGGNVENNGIFGEAMAKMQETLQAQGMSAEEAQAEAANTTPDVLNSLKERFQSSDEADKDFDLSNLAGLIPGGAGDLLNKVGGAGGILNAAKNLLGK